MLTPVMFNAYVSTRCQSEKLIAVMTIFAGFGDS